MTIFQMIMLAMAAFFAYKVYEHVMSLEAQEQKPEQKELTKAEEYIEKADRAFEEGNLIECKKFLREALYIEKENIELMLKLAYLESESENYDDAIEYAKDALKVDEKCADAYAALGSFYRHQKKYDKAKECYETAIELDDTHEFYYFNYANLLVDMQEREKAKEMYAKAIELDGDFVQAKFELEKLKNEAS